MKDEASGKPEYKIPASVKRPSKKKSKDKPKRPLSAYNFFFKEEREKIIKVLEAEDPEAVQDKESEDYMDEALIKSLRKDGGKVSFEVLGKVIGQRWKQIAPDKLSKFSELASEDAERYKREMLVFNGQQEAKLRSEAMNPGASLYNDKNASYPIPQVAPGRFQTLPQGQAPYGGMDMYNMQGFYPYQGAMGGMPYGMMGSYPFAMGYGGFPGQQLGANQQNFQESGRGQHYGYGAPTDDNETDAQDDEEHFKKES